MKTPEEYFNEKVQQPDGVGADAALSDAERAMLEKYLGVGGAAGLAKLPRLEPRGEDVLAGFASAPAAAAPAVSETTAPAAAAAASPMTEEPGLDEQLRQAAEVQLVSFYVGGQEYALPITAIQEVIRQVAPTRLPSAPPHLAGIVNLRGRVTPLLSLRVLLRLDEDEVAEADREDKFIIVCRRHDLQVGLLVTRVETMYRAGQELLVWGVESQLGIAAEYLAGLMKSREKLVAILSVDRLVEKVLA